MIIHLMFNKKKEDPMKRILFLVVSLFIAGFSQAADFSRDVVSKITNTNEISVSEQSQSLILEQAANMQMDVNRHYSHSSHSSHSSHRSHSSHYSSRF